MKKLILAAAVLAASVGAAEAKCSTKSLNGNWMLGDDELGLPIPVIINNGTATVSGTPIFTLTLNGKCKGNVTFSSPNFAGRVATERLAKTSTLKPNVLQIGVPQQTVGPDSTTGAILTLFRL